MRGFMAKYNVDGADDVKKTCNIPKIKICSEKLDKLENFAKKNQKKLKHSMIVYLLMEK